MMSEIHNILKPKSKEDIIGSAKNLDDPNKILEVSFNIHDNSLAKFALKKGASLNNIGTSTIPSDMFKIILDNISNKVNSKMFVYLALKNGFEKEIIGLLDKGFINKSMEPDICLWAVGFGKYELVKKMINKDIIIEDDRLIDALVLDISENNSDILKLIIDNSEIDPSLEHNRLLYTAVLFNNIGAVEFLLKDERVDPSSIKNYSFEKTSPIIKKMLMNDIRFVNKYNYRRELNKINNKSK